MKIKKFCMSPGLGFEVVHEFCYSHLRWGVFCAVGAGGSALRPAKEMPEMP